MTTEIAAPDPRPADSPKVMPLRTMAVVCYDARVIGPSAGTSWA
jgi:hypothetical protein